MGKVLFSFIFEGRQGGKGFVKQKFNSNISAAMELARPRGTKGEAETSGVRSLTWRCLGVQAQIPGLKWVRWDS